MRVTAQMDADNGVPLLRRHVDDGAIAQHAGVVDECVKGTPSINCSLQHAARSIDIGNVTGVEKGFTAKFFDFEDDCSTGIGVEFIDDHARPSRASSRASPRPMPRPAPVTIATLPSRSPMGGDDTYQRTIPDNGCRSAEGNARALPTGMQ